MKGKAFSMMLLLLIASLVATACAAPAPATAAAPAAEQPAAEQPAAEEAAAPADEWADVDPSGQTVVFWHQHTKDREAALNAIVEKFNQTNEFGITVKAEYQGGYSDIFKKMLAVLNQEDAGRAQQP